MLEKKREREREKRKTFPRKNIRERQRKRDFFVTYSIVCKVALGDGRGKGTNIETKRNTEAQRKRDLRRQETGSET